MFRPTRVQTTLTILLIAGFLVYGMGAALWQGAALAAFGGALLVLERLRDSRDRRRRIGMSFQEGRRCKGCDGDLWGLDVQPGAAGKCRVKCPECGSINEFKPRGLNRRSKPKPAQWDAADTRSFKIR